MNQNRWPLYSCSFNSSQTLIKIDGRRLLRRRPWYAYPSIHDVSRTDTSQASDESFAEALLRYPKDMIKCMAAFQLTPSWLSP